MSSRILSNSSKNNIDAIRKTMQIASEAFRAAVVQKAFNRDPEPEGYCPGQISCDRELFPTWEVQS